MVEPDIVVIVVSEDETGAENILKLLATALFHGGVMLMGSQARAEVARVQRLGEQLGLRMLPVLATPFRTAELKDRVVDLLPRQPPPPLQVDFTEALGNDWLELWYQPKIDLSFAFTARCRGSDPIAPSDMGDRSAGPFPSSEG